MSLRTLLVVIGIAIVLAVYWFGARRHRREPRLVRGRRFGRAELPDIVLSHAGEDDGDAIERGAETEPGIELRVLPPRGSTVRLPEDVVLPPEPLVVDELPAVRNDAAVGSAPPAPAPTPRRRIDQMDLFGGSDPPPPRTQARAKRQTEQIPAPAPGADDGLITLFVRARDGQQFAGPQLVRALNAVGMQHGERSIFHHPGPGPGQERGAHAPPVFSAANMYEPGTFDLARIEAFRTGGVVLFLELPAPLDGPVAFELLLNTAQRLAELSGGELYGDPHERLDNRSIQRLRARAALFPHART